MNDSAQHQRAERLTLTGYLAVALLLLALFAVGAALTGRSRNLLLHEGGLVETVSAAGYFVCVAVLLFRGGMTLAIQRFYIPVLVLFLGLRELDFDKRFTTMGIFKSRFFSSDTVPLAEKLIGAAVIVFLLYCLYRLLRGHLGELLRATRDVTAGSVGIWLAAGLLVFAKSIDGLDRKLKGFGLQISPEFTAHSAALEEILEMGIPLILLFASLAWLRRPARSS